MIIEGKMLRTSLCFVFLFIILGLLFIESTLRSSIELMMKRMNHDKGLELAESKMKIKFTCEFSRWNDFPRKPCQLGLKLNKREPPIWNQTTFVLVPCVIHFPNSFFVLFIQLIFSPSLCTSRWVKIIKFEKWFFGNYLLMEIDRMLNSFGCSA